MGILWIHSICLPTTPLSSITESTTHCTNAILPDRVAFKNTQCHCLQIPESANSRQEKPINFKYKRFINLILFWRSMCMGLKRLLQQNGGNFGCTWIEHNKYQPNSQMPVDRIQPSDWSPISIRWHQLNTILCINYSVFINTNYCQMWVVKYLIPERDLAENVYKWQLQQKKLCTGQQIWPLTSM